MLNMNALSNAERIRVVAALVQGKSIRSTSRMTGVARNTVTKLLVDLGTACMRYHDEHVRNVRVRRLQCDEIWAYAGAKARNVKPEKKEIGWGDVWTWVGIDADTKLVVSYLVGGRGADWAMDFMKDCAERILGRVQITTDGHRAYLNAVEEGFGIDADYAQLQEIFGASLETETRYSPAKCIGCDMKVVSGQPRPQTCEHVLRGTPEPRYADAHAALHSPDERIQQETRQSRLCCRVAFPVLQLRSHSRHTARHARRRSWVVRSCVEYRRNDLDGRQLHAEGSKARALQETNFKLSHYRTAASVDTTLRTVYTVSMPRKKMSVTVWVCSRCGHEWQSRDDTKPICCARCKSPFWDRPRRQAVKH